MVKIIIKRIKNLSFDRLLLFIFILFYVSTSHIFLPALKKNDFLFFFQWNMFTFMPLERVYDITWDEGKTFLLRDYRQKAGNVGINIRRFFPIITFNEERTAIIKAYFYKDIIYLCRCQKLKLFELKGSLSDHIIHKKPLEVQKQTIL